MCTGSEAAVNAVEVVGLDDVAVVALYLERLPDGRAYIDLLAKANRLGKRMVVLHAGLTEAGHHAANSHTAALVAPTAALTAASSRYGAIMVHDVAVLMHTAGFLSLSDPLPGNGVAVVTSSGGAEIPAYGSAGNPVDVTAGLFSLTADNDRRFCSVCLVIEAAGIAFLTAAGVPTPRSVLVRHAADAALAVREVGGRAVLKAQYPDIPDKAAVRAIRAHVGGGAGTEAYADTGSTLLPATRNDVLMLLRGLRCAPLLLGGSGRQPHDVSALADLVLRLADSYSSIGSDEMEEIELNPVWVYDKGEGVLALDFLAVWSGVGSVQ